MKFLNVFIVAAVAVSQSPDYFALKKLLKDHVDDSSETIAEWLRMSFHDLANTDGKGNGGPHGCIREEPARSFDENSQLKDAVAGLDQLVSNAFGNETFSFGDVVSMAGKVAAERAFPCIRIKWRPGRGSCKPEEDLVPGPSIQTYSDLQPVLDRYKFTRKEFGVLLAGAHGIKAARFRILHGSTPWTLQNSGFAFIQRTFELPWIPISGRVPTETPITHWFSALAVIRLPIDMLFFPDVVRRNKILNPFVRTIKVEEDAEPEQEYLRDFESNEEFNKVFADVLGKMLEVGTEADSLGEFLDESGDLGEGCDEMYFGKISGGL